MLPTSKKLEEHNAFGLFITLSVQSRRVRDRILNFFIYGIRMENKWTHILSFFSWTCYDPFWTLIVSLWDKLKSCEQDILKTI